jgi:hypothetical protein
VQVLLELVLPVPGQVLVLLAQVLVLLVQVLVLLVLPVPVPPPLSWRAQPVSFQVLTGSQPT